VGKIGLKNELILSYWIEGASEGAIEGAKSKNGSQNSQQC
jgi:hypothetical protein